jgi:hypothetical protein
MFQNQKDLHRMSPMQARATRAFPFAFAPSPQRSVWSEQGFGT